MHVVSIIITGVNHLDVGLGYGGLLVELLAQEGLNELYVAVEQPTDNAQREHVAALQHCLVVHSAVGKAVLHHLRDGACYHAVGINAHLVEVVLRLELGPLKVFRAETVRVDDDCSLRLSKPVLRLQCGGVHGHEHVTLVARREGTAAGDVNLES